MKNLKDYLNEGLLSRKVSTRTPIRYKPTTWTCLFNNIRELLAQDIFNFNCIDVSEMTDMNALFAEINTEYYIPEIDISEWDVSNVTDMANMFAECDGFTADLSKWNVSNVQRMDGMFFDCKEFNSDLSNWNVKNLTNANKMFKGCTNFNSDLSNWDMPNGVNTRRMFTKCTTLEKNNKIPAWFKE